MKFFRRPLGSPVKSSPAKKKSRTTSVGNMTSKACNYLQNNSYLLAFRTLLHRGSESVKRAYVKVFCELLIQEIKGLLSRDIFPVSVSENSISAFALEDTVDGATDVFPSITACLKSLLPDSKHISRKTSGPISNRSQTNGQPRTVAQLKKKYNNIKSEAKAKLSKAKHPPTGGGPPPEEMSLPHQIFLDMAGDAPNVVGITGGMESEMTDGNYNGYLLGDSGYPCRKYLMVPYPIPNGRRHQEKFNSSLVKTRVIVEQTFGILKRKFACLTRLHLAPKKACHVICVTAMLHNIAVQYHDIDDEGEISDLAGEDFQYNGNDRETGKHYRDLLANTYFN